MRAVAFNVNDKVRVKLTPRGLDILHRAHDEFSKQVRSAPPFTPPEVDADGWCEVQLWTLMQDFGAHIYNGCQVPFETTIQIPLPNQKEKEL